MDDLKKFVTKYQNGDVIYKKGDIQTEFFIINSGKVQLRGGETDFSSVPCPREIFSAKNR